MSDAPIDLDRFVEAQDSDGTYDRALTELRAGRKTSHWMWFVFPQIAGLGSSATSVRYAVSGLPEARAYLEHPVLGPRLHACVTALLDLRDRPATAILGPVDAAKLRSSMTLFDRADTTGGGGFRAVLDRYFAGEDDTATLARLN